MAEAGACLRVETLLVLDLGHGKTSTRQPLSDREHFETIFGDGLTTARA